MEPKTNWMQLLLIGLISSIFLLSCDKGDKKDYAFEDYIYMNLSNHKVYISSYKVGKVGSTIQIINSGYFKQTQKTSDIIDSLIINADSVKVIYDLLKFEMYRKTVNSEGILSKEDYSYKKTVDNHHEFTFTFTEDMYNDAQTIKQ